MDVLLTLTIVIAMCVYVHYVKETSLALCEVDKDIRTILRCSIGALSSAFIGLGAAYLLHIHY